MSLADPDPLVLVHVLISVGLVGRIQKSGNFVGLTK